MRYRTCLQRRCTAAATCAVAATLCLVYLPACCGTADTFIQKTKKLYQDTRSQRNVAALTADLQDVHTIMSRNIAEVLGQGEKLDSEFLLVTTRHRRVAAGAHLYQQ